MPAGGAERTLAEVVSAALLQAIEGMTGERPAVSVADMPAGSTPPEDCSWWRQSLSLAPNARVHVGAAENSWSTIGNAILKAAGIDDGDRESIRSTFSEIISQTFGGAARTLSTRLAQQVTSTPDEQSATAAPTAQPLWELRVSWGGVGPLVLLFAADQPLTEALETAIRGAERPASPPPPPARSAPDSDEAIRRSRKMELLLDVELPVSVSFGRAQLLLKDVIKLTTGSIIELNRSISEPVDVIVNNCVIARGEVVVVEGNFGVRVHEVVSRQERLRTVR
jgi:flagellar motor switch protein FliN/FliY